MSALEQQTLLDNADILSEVNFFWYELAGDGSIRGGVMSSPGLQAARSAGLAVLPSIMNNFSAERVTNVVADPARRRQHVQDIVDLVGREQYDGIDIDYESLAPADRDNFSLFIEELAAALHRQGKLLSIAVHPKTSAEGAWDGPAAQDWARLGAAVDKFKIMTYDYHWSTSEAGPIAPVAWAEEVIAYAATLVPPEKTFLGVHFYGYDWVNQSAESLVHRDVMKLVDDYQAQVERDESNEAYFTYMAGREHTVYFADALSVQSKLTAIFERHPTLAGIAIWRLGGEDPKVWDVIRSWAQGE